MLPRVVLVIEESHTQMCNHSI